MTNAAEKNLVITRIFNAPPELVWQAWTEPEHFQKWWGPESFTCPKVEIDLRVGGKNLFVMRSPDGTDLHCGGTFQEIVPNQKLVMTNGFTDQEGNRVHPSVYGMPEGIPEEHLLTVTFKKVDGKTELSITQTIPDSIAKEIGAYDGWNSSLDKLANTLQGAN